jgi:hypothetical protein
MRNLLLIDPGGRRLTVAVLAFAASLTAIVSHAGPTDWAGSFKVPTPEAAVSIASVLEPRVPRLAPARVSSDSGAAGIWQLVAPPAGIPRVQSPMVEDASRGRLIVFGGGSGAGYESDTWVFTIASGTWSPLATAGTPPTPRLLHGAIYDPVGDRMLVFGGWADSLLDDVWQLALSGTPTWSRLEPTGTPGGRASFASVYDARNRRMVIFGGYDGVTPPLLRTNDVWALSLEGPLGWTRIDPSGTPPAPRMGSTPGYDAIDGAMYVFGGTGESYSNELWKLTLDGTPAWSRVDATVAPPARAQQTGGYDPVSRRFVVFGGYDDRYLYGDLWNIDPRAATPDWTDVTPDPNVRARWGALGAVTQEGDLIVAGGVNRSGTLEADVWSIRVGSPVEWHAVSDLYPYRLQEVMVLDTARHRLVAFGGSDGAYRNDTYVHPLDTGRGWRPLATSGTLPGPRRLHTGVYDPAGDRLIVFGGFDDHLLGDLWELDFSGDGGTWKPMSAAGTSPSPRGGHVSIYDPVGRRMIVACGYDGVTAPAYRTGSTYALSLDGTPTWTPLEDGPPRSSASAIYDETRGQMVVFGGTNPAFLGDTWRLTLGATPSWSQVAVAAGPAAREEHAAVYDPRRDRMVIFGGYDTPTPYSHNYDDLWSTSLNVPLWQELPSAGTRPSPRWGMKAMADPDLDGMWVYGGWDDTYSQELFFLQWSDPSAPAAIATASAQAQADRADFDWQLPTRARSTVTIERSDDNVHWHTVGDLLPGATDVAFSDRSVAAGHRYAWRAVVRAGGTRMASAATSLTIPGSSGVDSEPVAFGLRLAGGFRPGSIAVSCALPRQAAGRLELFDVKGRVRAALDLSSLGAGEHRVELGQGLEAGIFFVRLSSGGRRATLKGVVLN